MTVDDGAEINVHATCVALGRVGALLRGAPGSGKSDLALRFMHQPRLPLLRGMEPALVADDRVILGPRRGRIVARAPAAIAGLIEIRGVGVERVPFQAEAEIRLIVDLVPVGSRPRLPPDPLPRERLSGVEAAVIALAPFEASAAAKLTLAMLKFA